MRDQVGNSEESSLHGALEHLRSALELLDSTSASSHIGAYVDLAIHELQGALNDKVGPQLVEQF